MTDVLVGLEPDLERRFGGLARLYGVDGAARIRAAHVVVIGIGGVGSWRPRPWRAAVWPS